MKEKGSRATINKHLRHLEEKEYVTCNLVCTEKGRSTIYKWNPTIEWPSKIISYKPPYVFLYIKNSIEISTTSNNKVHHTMIYNFRNQSDDVQQFLGIFIFGDLARSWQEINPHIYEENVKRIELGPSNISVADDGLRKVISAKFSSPLYTGKEKIIRFEYDWEEPNQYWEFGRGDNQPYLYEFELVYSHDKNYKFYVYEINHLTQLKKLAKIEPQVSDKGGKKFHKWQIEDPQIGQGFRFKWSNHISV